MNGMAEAVLKRPYLILLLTALFWGGNAVAGKAAVGVVPPMMLSFLRWAIAGTTLLVFARGEIDRDAKTIRASLAWLVAMGALGFGAFNLLLYSAVHHTTAINVAIEQSAMPMLIVAANFLFFRETIGWMLAAGVVLSLVGVMVIAAHGDLGALLGADVNRGDAMMLVAVALYAGYSVALRKRPKLHWASFLAVLSLSAAAASLPFMIAEFIAGARIRPGAEAALLILYVSLFPSFFAQLFYARGVELIGANRAGLFINLVPLFGSALAILFLGERLEFYHLVGYGLVVVGLIAAQRR
ncbi:MAG TPA: DMT family transporter [Hyphomicrobiales bacterium]|nr:DMT family transporter [Kaistiaceae bacterium]HQF30594.1 DMT family transporter [Hyphomicrobiales bacterium]